MIQLVKHVNNARVVETARSRLAINITRQRRLPSGSGDCSREFARETQAFYDSFDEAWLRENGFVAIASHVKSQVSFSRTLLTYRDAIVLEILNEIVDILLSPSVDKDVVHPCND